MYVVVIQVVAGALRLSVLKIRVFLNINKTNNPNLSLEKLIMLDYKLLQALAAIVEGQGFEKGAALLGISQSAISQRIKLLEARLGQPVLIRSPGLAPTNLGKRLLNHVQQVRLLEHDLLLDVPTLGAEALRLRIAINADSLATWWFPVMGDYCQREGVLLDLVIEDQDIGLKRMRDGDVAGCVCSAEQAVQGSRCVYLGTLVYRAYASPGFMSRYFPLGLNADALAVAPVINFGPDDQLQHRLLQSLGYQGAFPFHLCPSSEGFIRMSEAGLGYGMMPEIQAQESVAAGRLVEVKPGYAQKVPLYWHYWRQGGETLEGLTRHLCTAIPLNQGEITVK